MTDCTIAGVNRVQFDHFPVGIGQDHGPCNICHRVAFVGIPAVESDAIRACTIFKHS